MNEDFSIRPAAGEDRPFLVEMLALTLQTQPEFADSVHSALDC